MSTEYLVTLVAKAVDSDATPPFASTVERLYRRLSRRRRAELRELLVADIGPKTAAVLLSKTPDDEFSVIERLAVAAEAMNPKAVERVVRKFAEQPKIFLNLDSKTIGKISDFGPQNMVTTAADGTEVRVVDRLGPAPEPRFATVQVFEEKQPGQRGAELDEDVRLRERQWYQAVVSIRVKPVGLRTKEERRPIREPKQTAPVDIHVTVDAESADFKIKPNIGKIVLPPTGDATADAIFRLQPLRPTLTPFDVRKISFRLFYRYNLLETLTISAGILPIDADDQVIVSPMKFTQGRQNDSNDFDSISPCALHIYIEPENAQYRMTFTYPGVNGLKFTAPVTLTGLKLEDQMRKARKILFQISASDRLGKLVDGDTCEFQEHLKLLATLGADLWAVMFCLGDSKELSTIGKWLIANPLPDGAKVQISTETDNIGFVFAWNLLYDAPIEEGEVLRPAGFWGWRYVVEQRVIIAAPPVFRPDHVEIGAMYWSFSQTPDQQKFLEDLVNQAGEKIALAGNKPISDAKTAKQCLKAGSSQILYFFTHGHTRVPNGEGCGVTINDFVELYEKLPPDSATRSAWRNTYDSIKRNAFGADRSWIELRYGKLDLYSLYREIPDDPLPGQPLVILNMCDSAQVTPSLAESFIGFFLTRGAQAVVGTECSMRPVFADFAARQLLPALLRGEPIGEAVRQMRIAGANKSNLLGFAYTLFGAGDAALSPLILA